MDTEHKKVCWNRICFLLVLLFVICLTAGAFLYSYYHNTLLNEPCIVNGVLDLTDWEPDRNHVIHLDGQWEFYWNRWIVSDGPGNAASDGLVHVPDRWTRYKLDGSALPKSGIASYRIHVKNSPDTLNCVSYVPNFQSGYRIYFNDSLVTSRGVQQEGNIRRDIGPGTAAWTYVTVYSCSNMPKSPDFDLTVEVTGENLEGLTLTPVLAENNQEYLSSNFRYMLASAYFGVMLTSVVILAFILYGSFRGLQALLLFVFNLMMFARVLIKDEFFGLLQIFLPFRNYFVFSNILKVLTLLLPFIFFFYVTGIMELKIRKNRVKMFVVYEMVILVCISVCMKMGLSKEEFYFSLVSLLPFVPMLVFLYRKMMDGVEGVLSVSLCLMFLIGSLSTGSLYRSGLVVLNLSMIPPSFFLAFIVTQDYIFIHRIMDRHKAVLEAANLRLQLEESQTALMLSQIKPHFLYNALVAIQVLCTRDPQGARDAILNFSQYLRANMSSVSSSVPIPFEQELNHIKNYTAIEKLRFQHRLAMHYDIRATDFSVPPLTIEPLVENAIKHGATKNIEGGNVWLSSWETEDAYVVRVTDDGPGFDLSILESRELASHGLRNITFRLKQIAGARVSFESQPDQKTEVTVSIPKMNTGGEKTYESDNCR